MAIRTKLGETKKLDLSISAYFNKVKHLVDTLASISEPLCDVEFTGFILSGLDGEYDSLVEVNKERTAPIQPQYLYACLLGTKHHLSARCPDVLPDSSSTTLPTVVGANLPITPPPPAPQREKTCTDKQQTHTSVIVGGGLPHVVPMRLVNFVALKAMSRSAAITASSPISWVLEIMVEAMSAKFKWRSKDTHRPTMLMHPGTWTLELLTT
jgi:hypothetical protein